MLTKPSPAALTPADVVAQKRQAAAEAALALSAGEDHFRKMSLDLELASDQSAAYVAKEAALKACRRLRTEVVACKVDLAAAEFKASSEYLARLKAARAAMSERVAAGEDIESLNAKLYAATECLKSANSTILATGTVEDVDGGLVRYVAMESEFKLSLARAGFTWAANYYLDKTQIPSLVQRLKDANAHIIAGWKS